MSQRNYSTSDIDSWKFNELTLPEEWHHHLGDLAEGARMIIEGDPGNGKTEYVLQLSKMLANHYGKVNLNNVEQGKSKSFKLAFERNKIRDGVPPGKWMLCDKTQRTFDKWFARLQRPNSGRVIILDSADVMKLTIDQFMELHRRFLKKIIIVVCWSNPMDINSKKIKYMCDIKVKVQDFKAKVASRFGGNKTWDIWPDRKKEINLFNQ